MALTDAALTAAAGTLVDRYAPGVPAEVRQAAVHLVAESLRQPPFVSQIQFADQQYQFVGGMDIIRRSGASSILASYRRPRARVLEAS